MSLRLFLLSLIAPACMLVSGCEKQEVHNKPIVRPVLSNVVEEISVGHQAFVGTVSPKVQTPLGFRITGQLVARDVGVGDIVKQGQKLASVDPTSLQLAVGAAEAQLSNARAQLANAESVRKRAASLASNGTGTTSDLEKANQSSASAGATLAQANATLSKAQEDLSYAQLNAPFEGVVTATGAEVGQVVEAGDPVVTVARPQERDAVVDVPEGSPSLKIGTSFQVALQIDPRVAAAGTVREVSPSADAATRTLRIKIALANPPESFRLGSTVTATMQGPEDKQIVIPKTALVNRNSKNFVWVVDNKTTVVAREVVVGKDLGARVTVTEGLKPGERYVTAGVNSLSDGQKIKTGDDSTS